MIYWGEEAYKNLDALMAEMKNPETVKVMFNKFDDDGNNGMIDMMLIVRSGTLSCGILYQGHHNTYLIPRIYRQANKKDVWLVGDVRWLF